MIDLHCHLLPNVDDGPESLEESIKQGQLAKKNNISHIVCTPHHLDGNYNNPKEQILDSFFNLKAEFERNAIDVSLILSQEVRLTPDLIHALEKDELVFIDSASKYIQIEFPSHHIPRFSQQIITDLVLRGHIPIIVHPERNSGFQKNPNALIEFLEIGALAEVTVPSYLGYFGKKIQQLAVRYVHHGLVQLMASDTHGYKRQIVLGSGYSLMKKKEGIEMVQQFKKNARCVIEGEELTELNYSKLKKRNWQFY